MNTLDGITIMNEFNKLEDEQVKNASTAEDLKSPTLAKYISDEIVKHALTVRDLRDYLDASKSALTKGMSGYRIKTTDGIYRINENGMEPIVCATNISGIPFKKIGNVLFTKDILIDLENKDVVTLLKDSILVNLFAAEMGYVIVGVLSEIIKKRCLVETSRLQDSDVANAKDASDLNCAYLEFCVDSDVIKRCNSLVELQDVFTCSKKITPSDILCIPQNYLAEGITPKDILDLFN